jgi:hypothetical protein
MINLNLGTTRSTLYTSFHVLNVRLHKDHQASLKARFKSNVIITPNKTYKDNSDINYCEVEFACLTKDYDMYRLFYKHYNDAKTNTSALIRERQKFAINYSLMKAM